MASREDGERAAVGQCNTANGTGGRSCVFTAAPLVVGTAAPEVRAGRLLP